MLTAGFVLLILGLLVAFGSFALMGANIVAMVQRGIKGALSKKRPVDISEDTVWKVAKNFTAHFSAHLVGIVVMVGGGFVAFIGLVLIIVALVP